MIHGTILLVDDEVKVRRALGTALREEGHDVVEAASAREAHRLISRQPFDVLVVDNLMPDMTGLDLIRELATEVSEHERPQILMMTAHASVDSAIAAMKLGALTTCRNHSKWMSCSSSSDARSSISGFALSTDISSTSDVRSSTSTASSDEAGTCKR